MLDESPARALAEVYATNGAGQILSKIRRRMGQAHER